MQRIFQLETNQRSQAQELVRLDNEQQTHQSLIGAAEKILRERLAVSNELQQRVLQIQHEIAQLQALWARGIPHPPGVPQQPEPTAAGPGGAPRETVVSGSNAASPLSAPAPQFGNQESEE